MAPVDPRWPCPCAVTAALEGLCAGHAYVGMLLSALLGGGHCTKTPTLSIFGAQGKPRELA